MKIRVKMRLAVAFFLAGAAAVLWPQTPQIGGGTITTVVGDGCQGTDPSGIQAGCYNGDGPGTRTQVSFDLLGPIVSDTEEDTAHMAFDSAGNLYFADKGNQLIRKLDTKGNITTLAGGVGNAGFNGDQAQPGLSAPLNYPSGIFVDASGNIYIADEDNNRIRKIDTKNIITTVIGTGDPASGGGFNGDNLTALKTQLNGPEAVVVDSTGNIYFTDTYNNRLRKMDATTGIVTTVAGQGQANPSINQAGADNVPATSVALGEPTALALDGKGNLFISDMLNNVIRVVDLQTGLIRRIAGTGAHSDNNPTGDGGSPTQAPLGYPMGLAVDPATGDLWFSDMHNNVVRRIVSPLTANAVISTPIGFGTASFGGEGQAAYGALLNRPVGLALDGNGNLYVMDYYNQRIRKVTPGTNVPVPVLFQNGVVNGASFAKLSDGTTPAPVAPGSIISIFGRRLTPGRASASNVPLPTTLLSGAQAASATVTAGGVTTPVPLYYVSADQFNAQLPFETPPGQATVNVKLGAVQSNAVTFTVGPTAPGIFVYGNRAVAQNFPDYSLNTSSNPIARGGTVIVYLTGVGSLNPPVATGQAAPMSPLSSAAASYSAVFGGATATVSFLGAVPGLVGLEQANIVVPGNAQTGDVSLVIHVGNQDSNSAVVSLK